VPLRRALSVPPCRVHRTLNPPAIAAPAILERVSYLSLLSRSVLVPLRYVALAKHAPFSHFISFFLILNNNLKKLHLNIFSIIRFLYKNINILSCLLINSYKTEIKMNTKIFYINSNNKS